MTTTIDEISCAVVPYANHTKIAITFKGSYHESGITTKFEYSTTRRKLTMSDSRIFMKIDETHRQQAAARIVNQIKEECVVHLKRISTEFEATVQVFSKPLHEST
jgi:hypothetical protein